MRNRNILVLDVGGTAIKSGLISPEAKFIRENECSTDASRGAKMLIERICEVISGYDGFDAIGLSVTGQINSDTGRVVYATDSIPQFTNTPLREVIEARFGVPVCVENDVNCAAIGEGHYGAARDFSEFLCLTYGTGVGGAIVLDRKIYHGGYYSAGEFGHMLTHAGGRVCSCGNYGCYEAYASTKALTRRVHESTGIQLDGRQIFNEFHSSNEIISTIVNEWIDEIVYGLLNVTHLFNPTCIILGGGVMNQSYILDTVRAKLDTLIMPNYRQVQIKAAELGNKAGMLGAYYNALHSII
jgi:glucokinase